MVEERETIQPIVLIKNNDIVGMVLTSPKTAQKSLETGVLWEIHSQTKSEVEVHPRIPIISLYKKNRGYIAEIEENFDDDILEKALRTSLEIVSGANGEQELEQEPKQEPAQKTEIESGGIHQNGVVYDMLLQLQNIIISRKETLPEGSYTTHLFQSGKEKIRKKLGEEAIELILSPDKKSIISESADLLYHLLVLLVNEDVSIEIVLQELMRRHTHKDIQK